ncbi:succinate dehydrogenase assembly factor 2 [Lentibacter sp. XHP0401]|jgi:antitoxin CptB|uniref:succinate dehydrogenase assembly factor 2 n=1 Tax=Lentibacter sp. XHP0401 TaxID=2984334 RepID=UPI0021E9533F|nr:succinate dehydrogenase assembly factor 2 [Lentibacter sp. XHP0401]MCV2893288.1 succinate dehydrogenase assembly factor 2 [Lentibacter sp. XHP0401]
MSGETRDVRLKRLKMRSMRRGIKEMDLILMRFSEARLADLSADKLDLYENLLEENDHDLYQWVSGQIPAPQGFSGLIDEIAQHVDAR